MGRYRVVVGGIVAGRSAANYRELVLGFARLFILVFSLSRFQEFEASGENGLVRKLQFLLLLFRTILGGVAIFIYHFSDGLSPGLCGLNYTRTRFSEADSLSALHFFFFARGVPLN